MVSIADLVRRMSELGAPAEAIAVAIEALQEACSPGRNSASKGAARTRRWRENKSSQSVTVTSPSVTVTSVTSQAPSLNDPLPNLSTSEFNLNPPSKKAPTGPKKVPGQADGQFAAFWQAYPSRGSATNPKKPAAAAFERAVRSGHDPAMIAAAAKRYAATFDGPSSFVMQAERWLRNECWEQYVPKAEPLRIVAPKPAQPEPQEWDETRWRREISYARATGDWRSALGPAPGDPGCIAPPSLLVSSDYALRSSEAA